MARVYVGTFRKYNSGSIAGAWIDLASCATYSDFLTKCKAVHKDERDPEFMIQDTEEFPDGLSCMDWLSESDFNDVKAAMQEDTPAKKGKEGAPYVAALEEWVSTLKGDREYYRKSNAAAVRLPEGWFVVGKPSIENRFCFHDEGPDYETYKDLHRKEENMRAYFLHRNLSDFDTKLKWLEDDSAPVFVRGGLYQGTAEIVTRQYSWDWSEAWQRDWRQLTAEERKQIAGALRFVRDGFEKRLQAYLNRYGTSKIHTWTYWAEA